MSAAVPRLLVVDDEAPQLQALVSTLQASGYSVQGYAAPREALAQLARERYDVLLTDLRMPEMDGMELLAAALARDPDLVVVLMTGHGTIGTAVEAMKAGALDYILKPFRIAAVRPVLERALAVRKLRVENAALVARLRERTAELEAANRELDAFSYSVSHDLRAPLRHVQGYADELAGSLDGRLEGEQPRYLQAIRDSARRMGTLIDSLLEFARLGRAELAVRNVDMARLVGESIEQLRPDAMGREVQWVVGGLPEALGDRSLLSQVMTNLLSNALKYSRTRAVSRVEIGCEPDGGGMGIYRVRDNGVGFDMRYAERLFGVFQRMHRESEFEGVGIGLANVRSIVQRHGGTVWAEAEPGKGAVFSFTLRLADRDGKGAGIHAA